MSTGLSLKRRPVPKHQSGPEHQQNESGDEGTTKGKGGKGKGEKGEKQEPVFLKFPTPKVVHKAVTATVYQKGGNHGAFTVEQAKKAIGWTEVPKDERTFYHFSDYNRTKVFLANNVKNRPFRIALARRYMSELLRSKWQLNGETIIIDRCDQVESGAHRFVGLILGEQLRQRTPNVYKRFGINGPLTMECIIVRGVKESREVIDTLDLGQKRSLGDVLYRDRRFEGPVDPINSTYFTENVKKRLANSLAGAIRLAWLRSGGQKVSDAPHFPHSEALDFIANHPKLVDAILFLWGVEAGGGRDGRRISRFLSFPYACALYYLMATSNTDPEKYQEHGSEALNFKMQPKAAEFWTLFASGSGLKAGSPILTLRDMLPDVITSGGAGRDEVVCMVVKAFNLWMDGKKATESQLTVEKSRNDRGKMVIDEWPRLGGIDVDEPTFADEELGKAVREMSKGPGPAPKVAKPKKGGKGGKGKKDKPAAPAKTLTSTIFKSKKGKRAKKEWGKGDQAWVNEGQDVDPWFGTLTEVHGKYAILEQADTGEEWDVRLDQLQLEYPK